MNDSSRSGVSVSVWRTLSALGIGLGLACSGGPAVPLDPPLPDPVDGVAPDPDVERPPSPIGVPDPETAPKGKGEDPTTEEPSAQAVVVSRARLEKELAEVERVDEVITFRPHITLRGVDGFKVTGIPSGSPLEGIGLQRGDVVHSVNGIELGSLGELMAAADALQSADRYEGEITRNGERQRLVVTLQ